MTSIACMNDVTYWACKLQHHVRILHVAICRAPCLSVEDFSICWGPASQWSLLRGHWHTVHCIFGIGDFYPGCHSAGPSARTASTREALPAFWKAYSRMSSGFWAVLLSQCQGAAGEGQWAILLPPQDARPPWSQVCLFSCLSKMRILLAGHCSRELRQFLWLIVKTCVDQEEIRGVTSTFYWRTSIRLSLNPKTLLVGGTTMSSLRRSTCLAFQWALSR